MFQQIFIIFLISIIFNNNVLANIEADKELLADFHKVGINKYNKFILQHSKLTDGSNWHYFTSSPLNTEKMITFTLMKGKKTIVLKR